MESIPKLEEPYLLAIKAPFSKAQARLERLIGCDRCVLVKGYAGSAFEKTEDGKICSFCKEFRKREFLGKEALFKDLSLRDDEKVGVTVSGGKDSTYIWLWLVENFGSDKVVAFNHKKVGLVHPLAQMNLKSAERKLGSVLVQLEDHEFLTRFKNNLCALLSKPDPLMVRVALCAGCRFGISGKLFQEAEKLGIKKMINGASYLELAPFKRELLRMKGDGNETKGLLRGLMENTSYYFPGNLAAMMVDNEHCHASHLSEGKNRALYPSMTYLDFYKYFPNIPSRIERRVEDGLNWKKPGKEDWHFDCLVEPFKNLFYYGLLGYTEVDYKLCEMVRYDIVTREEALMELYDSRRRIIASKNRIFALLKKIGSEDLIQQFNKFIQQSGFLS
jgi:hypothetical protein